MILEAHRNYFKEQLRDLYPPEELDAIVGLAFQYVLEKNRVEIALSRKQNLTTSQQTQLELVLKRLLQSEPIQYIIGNTEFYGLELELNKATLIPRPETEELVEWVLSDYSKTQSSTHILDIGTGSGCIAIALAVNLPLSKVEAVDISMQALETAETNSQNNEVAIRFFQQDILKTMALEKPYDIIVSNPPYVREQEKIEIRNNVLQYEPHQALFVADTTPLVFYRKIAQLAKESLKPNGALYFEINEYLGAETVALVKEIGFKQVELRKDLFGKDRMLRAML